MTEIVINGVIYDAQISQNGVNKAPSDEAQDAICDLVREHMRYHATQFQRDIHITSEGIHANSTNTHDFQLSPPIKEKHNVSTATQLFAKIIAMPEAPDLSNTESTRAATEPADENDEASETQSVLSYLSDSEEFASVSSGDLESEYEFFDASDGEESDGEEFASVVSSADLPAAQAPLGEERFERMTVGTQREAYKALAENPRSPEYAPLRRQILNERNGEAARMTDDRYVQLKAVMALDAIARLLRIRYEEQYTH